MKSKKIALTTISLDTDVDVKRSVGRPKVKEEDSHNTIQYGVHLGKIIRDVIDANPKYNKSDIARELGMSVTGFFAKLEKPNYGDSYDIIAISMLLKHDFFSYTQAPLRNKGVDGKKIYSEYEFDELKTKYHEKEQVVIGMNKQMEILYRQIELLEQALKNKG